ncbi:hypothetical protein T07_7786 [Trichinella nelsoni]|uniref:Uncharacterized protein n=1 Tax=Trichinella nelsoni TaxID=6336 RepID=A0A0V0SH96_9BILA|nr:hypothetical protein T07_7786 [Trichinella nelsoni]
MTPLWDSLSLVTSANQSLGQPVVPREDCQMLHGHRQGFSWLMRLCAATRPRGTSASISARNSSSCVSHTHNSSASCSSLTVRFPPCNSLAEERQFFANRRQGSSVVYAVIRSKVACPDVRTSPGGISGPCLGSSCLGDHVCCGPASHLGPCHHCFPAASFVTATP